MEVSCLKICIFKANLLTFLGQKEKIYDIIKSEPLQFTPRLYTCDNHSTIINLKDFDQFPEYSNYVSCFFSHKSLAEHEDGKLF